MKAIVYTSNSGFTKHYAELLAQETGLPVYSLKKESKKVPAGSEIIYLGWLMAGIVKGYKKAAKMYTVKAVCAVGMACPTEKYREEIQKKFSDGLAVFYLQGGFDIKKLHGIYKFMMQSMSKAAGKKLEEKKDKTDEEIIMLDLMKNGGDMVRRENLDEVLTWYRR